MNRKLRSVMAESIFRQGPGVAARTCRAAIGHYGMMGDIKAVRWWEEMIGTLADRFEGMGYDRTDFESACLG